MKKDNMFYAEEMPRKLSDEEQRYYFERYSNGDMDARRILIEHNVALVISFVSKYFSNTDYDERELCASGMIGLIKAVDSFDLKEGVKFSSYARPCIDNEILMYMRKNNRHRNNISYEQLYYGVEDDEIAKNSNIADKKDAPFDILEKEETRMVVRQLVATLPEREQKVISLYFGLDGGECLTQREIAEVLNVGQTCISKIIRTSLKTMRETLIGAEAKTKVLA